MFERALELDPDYADAYAGLARSYVVSINYENSVENTTKSPAWGLAKANLGRALGLNQENAEGLMLYAYMQSVEWKFRSAERNFQRGFIVDKNATDWEGHYWYSRHLESIGQYEEALAQIQLVEQANPLHPFMCHRLNQLIYLGRDADALSYISDMEAIGQSAGCFDAAKGNYAFNTNDAKGLESYLDELGAFRYRQQFLIDIARGDEVGIRSGLESYKKDYDEGRLALGHYTMALLHAGQYETAAPYLVELDANQSFFLNLMAAQAINPHQPSQLMILPKIDLQQVFQNTPELVDAYADIGIDLKAL